MSQIIIFVSIVSIRQLKTKIYMNMCDLFTMESNKLVCNVTTRQLGNKSSTTCAICSYWSSIYLYAMWPQGNSETKPSTTSTICSQ